VVTFQTWTLNTRTSSPGGRSRHRLTRAFIHATHRVAMSTALSTRARAIRLYRCVRLRFPSSVSRVIDRASPRRVDETRVSSARRGDRSIHPSTQGKRWIGIDGADETTRARGEARARTRRKGGFVNRANGRDRTRWHASFERLTVRDSARFAGRLGLRCARF